MRDAETFGFGQGDRGCVVNPPIRLSSGKRGAPQRAEPGHRAVAQQVPGREHDPVAIVCQAGGDMGAVAPRMVRRGRAGVGPGRALVRAEQGDEIALVEAVAGAVVVHEAEASAGQAQQNGPGAGVGGNESGFDHGVEQGGAGGLQQRERRGLPRESARFGFHALSSAFTDGYAWRWGVGKPDES